MRDAWRVQTRQRRGHERSAADLVLETEARGVAVDDLGLFAPREEPVGQQRYAWRPQLSGGDRLSAPFHAEDASGALSAHGEGRQAAEDEVSS